MRPVNLLVSLLAGFGALIVVGVVLIELLDPYIWPSAIVALPVGAIVGIVVAAVTYVYMGDLERGGDGADPDARH